MIMVSENLFVGSMEDLSGKDDKDWAFVHATKTMYKRVSVAEDYLFHEEQNRLFLNWVDADSFRYFDFKETGANVVIRALDFIDKWRLKRKVIVHCDKGNSRGPSLAMTYLSKRVNNTGETYDACSRKFYDVYEDYDPGAGISMFLYLKWSDIK